MSNAIIGGPRHYKGRGVGGAYKWRCACGAENVTPLERGCPSCGAGTPEQAALATAQAQQKRGDVPYERVVEEVLGENAQLVQPDYFLQFQFMRPAARATVAIALAHYADHGDPNPQLLPKAVILAWARWAMSFEEEAAATPAAPTEEDAQ